MTKEELLYIVEIEFWKEIERQEQLEEGANYGKSN